ncbi:MAG: trigger factor [Bacteroidales bacterium]|nr:trigger factor [Bacteroidales bacterium]
MNITQEKIDELNACLKIKIEKEDYQEKVDNVLKDYRKKAKIDGFRHGMVPKGLIKKMYGTAILVEEINKLVSESISKFLIDEKLNILGEPLPNEKEQKPIDWDNQQEFELTFDLGLAPEFELNLTKRDKIPYYDIIVDDEFINSSIENHTKRYGTNTNVDITEDSDLIKGEIIQVNEKDEIVKDGIKVEDALISLAVIKNEEIKKKFIGANIKQIITFNPKTAFENETEISSLLKISKDEAKNLNSDFQITISEILRFVPAEINQELFDKVYGKDVIKNEEEFKNKIEKDIKISLNKESDYRLIFDAKEKLIKKFKLNLPDEFLKRWLLVTNKELTEEKIDKEFEYFINDLQWQLIKNKIIKNNELNVTENEILEYARNATRMQLMQYGMMNIEDEMLNNYAQEILNKPEEKQKISESLYENKIIDYLKEKVKIDTKQITFKEFNKLFEK